MKSASWLISLLLMASSMAWAADPTSRELCEKNLSKYKQQLEKHPGDDLTWTEFRVCVMELKKWDDAIQVALTARQKNRSLSQPYLMLGLAQMQQKNYDRAIEHFDQSIGIRSNQPLAY